MGKAGTGREGVGRAPRPTLAWLGEEQSLQLGALPPPHAQPSRSSSTAAAPLAHLLELLQGGLPLLTQPVGLLSSLQPQLLGLTLQGSHTFL